MAIVGRVSVEWREQDVYGCKGRDLLESLESTAAGETNEIDIHTWCTFVLLCIIVFCDSCLIGSCYAGITGRYVP